jgi:hypothetical protein
MAVSSERWLAISQTAVPEQPPFILNEALATLLGKSLTFSKTTGASCNPVVLSASASVSNATELWTACRCNLWN